MRIERLVVEGFGPFAARQEIDFRPLDAAGLFLITGRTGSGKSSLLDAVCFALYGSAPRYDGTTGRLRSDHAAPETPTAVELEFAVAGEHWRVVRSPEYDRPKKRGDGTTRSAAAASLERRDGSEWVGVAARPVDVAEHLQPVLQLTREQFLQVILLAQGRFQDFLRARSEERLGLLRALFGTERFAKVEEELAQRARALEESVSGAAADVRAALIRLGELTGTDLPQDAGPAWAAEAVAALSASADAAVVAERMADAGFRAADSAAADAVALAELQRRRASAQAESARLDAEEARVAAQRARLDDAVRALPVLPLLDGRDTADAALAVARTDRDRAAVAVDASGGEVDDPAAAASALDAELGALAAPLAEERRLPALRSATEAADAEADASAGVLESARAALAAVPARRRELETRRESAVVGAADEGEARSAVVAAQAVHLAAQEAIRREDARRTAELALGRALQREEAAVQDTRRLVAARMADAAGRLVATLVPHEPCPVCGSTEHPSPAEPGADAVDDAALAAAEAAQDAAAATRAAASTAAAAARQALAVAQQQALGRTVEQAASALDAARRRLEAALEAAAVVAALDLQLAASAEEETRLTAEVRTAELAAAAARDAAVGARQGWQAAAARVAAARADAGSVAARAAALQHRRDLLRDLDRSVRAVATAAGTAADRAATVEAALAEAGFADDAVARAVAVPMEARAALAAAVRAHESARQVAAATLADPRVAAAAEQAADPRGAQAAKTAALEARDLAADARAQAVARAADGAELAESIRAIDEAVGAERQQLAVLAPLAAVLKGDGANSKRMRLESFVLAARLEQIVAAANTRLAVMTDGRFALRHDDSVGYRNTRSGLGLEVFDEHTGRARTPASLSGGETFLASLALALGLAEVVSAEAGGVRLDTLFVDEGFGSLDRETLDTAMRTLDSLRAGGRVVGLISHVEAMQEDVPAGLHVERLPDGTSRVRPRT